MIPSPLYAFRIELGQIKETDTCLVTEICISARVEYEVFTMSSDPQSLSITEQFKF